MITPQIIIISIALGAFGLMLVLAGIRLHSAKETTIFYLTTFIGLLFLVYVATLINLLEVSLLWGIPYSAFINTLLLAMILAFGLLSLSFLRAKQKYIANYWGVAALLLFLWSTFSFNLWGLGSYINQTSGLDLSLVVATASWVLAIAVVYTALWKAFKEHPSAKHLNRLRYWLIATTSLGASGLTLFISPDIFYWAGTLLLLAGSGLAGYIVLSYRTADLNLLIGRALRYTMAISFFTAIYYLGLAATTIFSRSQNAVVSPVNVFVWSVILALSLAVIMPPLWNYTNRLLTRIVFGKKRHDEKALIKHFSRSISSALDMQRLGDILINLMVETFNIEYGVVFINERGDSSRISLQVLDSTGIGTLTDIHFNSDSLFINHFRKGNKFLYQYDIDILPEFSTMDTEERAWLTNLNMELFVPIIRHPNIMGMLAFGPKIQKAAYHQEDVELMITLADQALLAIDGAHLFKHLASINQEVDVLNAKLHGLDQNKTDFLSIASHELRTPLTHVHGYSRMLLDLTEEEAKDFSYVKTIVQGITKGSERMKNVLDTMFDVTEANVGEMSLFLGPVDLSETVAQASGPFLAALDERRIAFAKKGFDDLPTIEADGTRLVQALENLISNAIKYTPDGGVVTVEGKSIVLDNIGSAVEITVADTGIGIASGHHERIFDKFFRVDDTDHHSTGKTKFKGAGPGLGLTLVKGIAEAHGGKVWVESTDYDENNCPGSKFFFTVPLHPAKPLQLETRKQSQIETIDWTKKKEGQQ